jgi:hypothetical protein
MVNRQGAIDARQLLAGTGSVYLLRALDRLAMGESLIQMDNQDLAPLFHLLEAQRPGAFACASRPVNSGVWYAQVERLH